MCAVMSVSTKQALWMLDSIGMYRMIYKRIGVTRYKYSLKPLSPASTGSGTNVFG